MSFLTEKIQKQEAADSADLRKTSYDAGFQSANRAESCGFEYEPSEKSANPQTVRTLKPLPRKEIRKSANPHDESTESTSPKSRLVRLTIDFGIDHGILLDEKEIAALIPPSDWRDAEKCDREGLRLWAACLALRALRFRGIVPDGWDKVAICAGCGPVWSHTAGEVLACEWCEMTRAGKCFPVPEEQASGAD